MTEENGIVKQSGEPEGPSPREDSAPSTTRPYYLSWYRLVFPGHQPFAGKTAVPPGPENGQE